MEPFNVYKAKVAVMNRVNVDTDQIIPKQFLRKIGKTGFGEHLFHDWRYLDDMSPNPDFELNRPEYQGAGILLAGDNFGCGSSREHAPWALNQFGFRSIISTSFADIFFNNCYKNGMLPIVVDEPTLKKLFDEQKEYVGSEYEINLPEQVFTTPSGMKISFDVDPFRKDFLINGLDDIGWTMRFVEDIDAYEQKQRQTMPWLW